MIPPAPVPVLGPEDEGMRMRTNGRERKGGFRFAPFEHYAHILTKATWGLRLWSGNLESPLAPVLSYRSVRRGIE